MLILERQQMIIELLNQQSSMTVNELAQMCFVSKETVRRDLRALEEKGVINRSHGGAMLLPQTNNGNFFIPKSNSVGTSFRQRILVNTDAKTRIARQAMQLVNPTDRIALDSGSTCWFFARQLPNIDITVITYSVNTINSLAAKRHIQVFVLGGAYNANDEDMGGTITEKMLANFSIDKVFFSCDGLDFDAGIGDNNDYHARLKKQMILSAREVILLVDSTKFTARFFSKICNFGYIDTLVTDKEIDQSLQKAMDWHNVKVIVA